MEFSLFYKKNDKFMLPKLMPNTLLWNRYFRRIPFSLQKMIPDTAQMLDYHLSLNL